MAINWSIVTPGDIEAACRLFDSAAVTPSHPARSTFLLFNGKSYPAKFIRGLSYRLATGKTLDPNRDYSGGLETVRFFERFGLATSHTPLATGSTTPASAEPNGLSTSEATTAQRLREPQKQALADHLRRCFRGVEVEAQFPWLVVPQSDQSDPAIRKIYEALKAFRGFSEFATPGIALRCDFYVPSHQLIIEYDERQHFTLQRAKSLELYPLELSLGFDRDDWITTCRIIQAADPTPPYRDEQRAFYDSLRDILAAQNGFRLVRLSYSKTDSTGPRAGDIFDTLLSGQQVTGAEPYPVTANQPAPRSPVGQITKIALVSHDYNVPDSRGLYDYSENFALINKLCDEEGCDTILFPLYTWDQNSPIARDYDAIFGDLSQVHRVILEVGDPPNGYDHVEVWQRTQPSPTIVHQRFARSTDSGSSKLSFFRELDKRLIGNALVVLCGETNIASLIRRSDEFYDPFGFADRLREMDIRLILNPIHDYMTRYEMREKRRYYSLGGRTVISVWNQGRRRESQTPWTIFHDGQEATYEVRELPRPISDRPDIRIGIVNLSLLVEARNVDMHAS